MRGFGLCFIVLVLFSGGILAQTPAPDTFLLPTPIAQETLDSAEAYLERGQTWFDNSQFVYALEDFTLAMVLDDTNTRAQVWQIRTMIELGDFSQAIVNANTLLERLPQDPDALTLRAYAQVQLNENSAQAQTDLQLVVLSAPTETTLPYYYLGQLLLVQADYERVVAVAEQALALFPENTDLLLLLGLGRHGQGRNDEAFLVFDRVQTLLPTSALPAINKALIYRKQGNLEQAIQQLDEAITRNENAPTAYMLRGIVKIQRGNTIGDEAQYRAFYESALADLETYFRLEHPAQVLPAILSLRTELVSVLGR